MTPKYRYAVERVRRSGNWWWCTQVYKDAAETPFATVYSQTRIGARYEGWRIVRQDSQRATRALRNEYDSTGRFNSEVVLYAATVVVTIALVVVMSWAR